MNVLLWQGKMLWTANAQLGGNMRSTMGAANADVPCQLLEDLMSSHFLRLEWPTAKINMGRKLANYVKRLSRVNVAATLISLIVF